MIGEPKPTTEARRHGEEQTLWRRFRLMNADQVAPSTVFVRDISWTLDVMRLPQAPALASPSFLVSLVTLSSSLGGRVRFQRRSTCGRFFSRLYRFREVRAFRRQSGIFRSLRCASSHQAKSGLAGEQLRDGLRRKERNLFEVYPHLRLRFRSPSVWANLWSRLRRLRLRCFRQLRRCHPSSRGVWAPNF